MSERIKYRLNALSEVKDAEELRKLMTAVLADLTELRTELAAAVADNVANRIRTAAAVVDLGVLRTPIAATIVDVAAARTALNTAMMSPAGLAIGGGSKYTAQAAKPFMAIAGGTYLFKPAATAMSDVVGTIAQTKFALWAWYIDSAGTITSSSKTADADSAALAFALMPAIPANKAQIGCMIVTNSGEAWDAGTDALDKASTTVIYIDTVGMGPNFTITASAPAALTVTTPAALTASTPAALTLLA
jgi:hypothetical protein